VKEGVFTIKYLLDLICLLESVIARHSNAQVNIYLK
jgi:hypothetical protein